MIELTLAYSGRRVLVNPDFICLIQENVTPKNEIYTLITFPGNDDSCCVVKESYEDVKAMLPDYKLSFDKDVKDSLKKLTIRGVEE